MRLNFRMLLGNGDCALCSIPHEYSAFSNGKPDI